MMQLKEALERFDELLRTNGEVRKLALLFGAALIVWFAGWWVQGMGGDEVSRVAVQEERFGKFLDVVRMYREVSARDGAEKAPSGGDAANPLTTLTGIVERLGMASRKPEYNASGKSISFRIDGLYAEELLTLLQEIEGAGLRVGSAELKTLPEKDGKLFSVSLMVEGNA